MLVIMKKNQTTIQLMVSFTVNHNENECTAEDISTAAKQYVQDILDADTENTEFSVLNVGETIVPVYESSVDIITAIPTAYDYSNHVLNLIP